MHTNVCICTICTSAHCVLFNCRYRVLIKYPRYVLGIYAQLEENNPKIRFPKLQRLPCNSAVAAATSFCFTTTSSGSSTIVLASPRCNFGKPIFGPQRQVLNCPVQLYPKKLQWHKLVVSCTTSGAVFGLVLWTC